MRAILRFFARFKLLIVFLLLEGAAVVLIIQNNKYHQAAFFNSSNAVAGNFYTRLNNFTAYTKLGEVNDSLVNYISRLHAQLPTNQLVDTSNLFPLPIDSSALQRYYYTGTKVINNTVAFRNNYLTLDKGSLAGIKARSAVVSPLGIVGIVKDVSPHFSTVISVLNKNARISARLKSTGTAGTVLWSGGNYREADLIEIPEHVDVKVGETVLTSPYSSIFPDGLYIGRVSEINLPAGSSTYEIKLSLGVDFKKLNYVWVVEDHLRNERDSLESQLTYE